MKSLDLLIATYGLGHGLAILTGDAGVRAMQRAGVRLLLAEP